MADCQFSWYLKLPVGYHGSLNCSHGKAKEYEDERVRLGKVFHAASLGKTSITMKISFRLRWRTGSPIRLRNIFLVIMDYYVYGTQLTR